MRPRITHALFAVAVALVPVACSSHHTAAPARRTIRETATTVEHHEPWLTVIATANVPTVQVYKTKPGDTSLTTAPTLAPGARPLPPIPRDGLDAAGVVTTATGYSYNNPTYFKNPLVFDVVHDDGDWLEVSLLARPNEQTGWVKRTDVTLSTTHYHLVLKVSTFDLTAFDGDKTVAETKVVVGTPGTPTPTGTFYLTEKIPKNPGGDYGPWIMATSAYSETLASFDGGLPQVAFHGTNRPQLIGTQASNGCVRMPDAVDVQLAQLLPAGTPVTITA